MATASPIEPDQQWEHKFAEVQNGVTLHYIDVGPRDATPLVLLHGWPDLWFAWRHQIGPLSQKYRVIVPDNRGHGQSYAPKEASNYGMKAVADDIMRLLDILEIPKAVFIGHDWGGALVWRICLYHPTRVQAVCGILTPYMPPSKEYVDLDTMVKASSSLAYMKMLSQGELVAKLLDQAPRRVFTLMFRRHNESSGEVSLADAMKNLVAVDHPMYTVHSSLITDEELAVYEREYKRTGFQSTLHWYGTREIDFETERGLPMFIQHKALYIGARNDRILKPEMAAHMPKLMPNLEITVIEDAGHWVLWEQHEKVNETLLNWLEKLE